MSNTFEIFSCKSKWDNYVLDNTNFHHAQLQHSLLGRGSCKTRIYFGQITALVSSQMKIERQEDSRAHMKATFQLNELSNSQLQVE